MIAAIGLAWQFLFILPFAYVLYRFFALRQGERIAPFNSRRSMQNALWFLSRFVLTFVTWQFTLGALAGIEGEWRRGLIFLWLLLVLQIKYDAKAIVACLLALIGGVLVDRTLFELYFLDGPSVDDSITRIGSPSSRQVGIASHLNYYLFRPTRGAVVLTRSEKSSGVPPTFQSTVPAQYHVDSSIRFYVGRVVALPGETVELVRGAVRINGVVLKEPYLRNELSADSKLKLDLGASEYLLAEDWRKHKASKSDCNPFYVVHERQIRSRHVFLLWPVRSFGFVQAPVYEIPDPTAWKLRLEERWIERLAKM